MIGEEGYEGEDERSSLHLIDQIPEGTLPEKFKMMKNKIGKMIPKSLDSYAYTYYIHEWLKSSNRKNIIEEFYQKVTNI